MKRRQAITTAGIALSTFVGGCLEATTDGQNSSNENMSEPIESWEYDVCGSSPSLTYDEVASNEHSLVIHIKSGEEAEDAFTTESLSEEARKDVESFVDKTEFETAMLFYIETRAPNGCHTLQIQSLDITSDNILTGSIKSKDTSGEDEICPAAEATPSRLVRLTAKPTLPTHGELNVEDGWGEAEQVTSVPLSK